MQVDDDAARVLGARIRHHRTRAGLTLTALAATLDTAASTLSLIENGRRPVRAAELPALAGALGVDVLDLLRPEAPDARSALELELHRLQAGPQYATLGVPPVRVSRSLPQDALQALVRTLQELDRRARESSATPEEARRANTELRLRMRARDNALPEIDALAEESVAGVGHEVGALTHREVARMAERLGFSLLYVDDLPHSTRSITDLENGRIYLPPASIPGGHGLRSMALQAMAHRLLGHRPPATYAEFLEQRLEINYFAAACLMPRRQAVAFLTEAKAGRDLAVEDFRDAFGVTHESAAMRMTNLLTEHLGIRVHFLRVGEDGAIARAYENDGLPLPTDVTGAVEGQVVCRRWVARRTGDGSARPVEAHQYTDTTAGTYWSSTQTGSGADGDFSITFGVRFDDAKWFRGRETTRRQVSTCPDESCCRRPPAPLAARWAEGAWPSARMHTRVLAALPSGRFPGVDDTEVFAFLERHTHDPA
ncbi:XRE family transcriptional regulator [Curtobacterium sp. 'Ferrero']|uniref:helix-turn-helix domain-containing protein n=1 Tax=Curtobacterium sp. 'Ferrero' TaxID=2033654 RepID=UPI000BC9710A|nr:helix-turn-helix domain-containing protein [Curtobacterium sp. 'Ferrero']PCN46451.1 XRE family transcriptional regulator [Curtobacterium sp. 'Ferrero']